jgi:hypothetical protein
MRKRNNLEILEGDLSDFIRDVAGDKEVKTEAIAGGIRLITGTDPIIDRSNAAFNTIRFTKQHQSQVEALFNKNIKTYRDASGKTQSSNVKIDAKSLYGPLVFKLAWPYLLTIFALGFALGGGLGRLTKG